MTRRLRNLLRDDDGAAIVELAIVAPVLALLTMGIIDISQGFSRKLQLEQGVQRAVEKVMQTTGVLTVEDTIATEVVCQVNGTNNDGSCKSSPITTANVTVEHRVECNAVVEADGDCEDDQAESRWIKVTVSDDFDPMFPTKFTGTDGNGKYRLVATAGMRTQ